MATNNSSHLRKTTHLPRIVVLSASFFVIRNERQQGRTYVRTSPTSFRATLSATMDELPCAMLANGPAWTSTGVCSAVCIRVGFIASFVTCRRASQERHKEARARRKRSSREKTVRFASLSC